MKKPMFAVVLLITLAMTSIPTLAQPATEPTFVAVLGRVKSYGGELAYGYLGAFAEVGEWAEVGLFWTLEPVHIAVIPYNYSFYAARLVSTATVELNYSGSDFYVSGLWDVYNVTFYYKEDGYSWEFKVIIDHGSGELNVKDDWMAFTVDIDGIPQVAGMVLRYCIRLVKPIPIGDVTFDGEIDIYDLVHMAKAYGNTPGIGSYYFEIDLDANYVIDIYDLTTLAANLGETY